MSRQPKPSASRVTLADVRRIAKTRFSVVHVSVVQQTNGEWVGVANEIGDSQGVEVTSGSKPYVLRVLAAALQAMPERGTP